MWHYKANAKPSVIQMTWKRKTNFTFNNKGFKQEFEGCLYKILISSFVYEFVENMLNFKESETLHKMQKAGLAA